MRKLIASVMLAGALILPATTAYAQTKPTPVVQVVNMPLDLGCGVTVTLVAYSDYSWYLVDNSTGATYTWANIQDLRNRLEVACLSAYTR